MAALPSKWAPHMLRVTIFTDAKQASASLEQVFDAQLQTKQFVTATQTSTEIGSFGVGLISMASSPNRVDFVWQVDPSDAPDGGLGDAELALRALTGPLTQWVSSSNVQLQRVALGGFYRQPVADRVAGYQRLSEYLPNFQVDAESASDFLLQINRPALRELAGNQVTINRMCKWGVQLFQITEVSLDTSSGKAMATTSGEAYMVSVEQDFNTALGTSSELLSGSAFSSALSVLTSEAIAFLRDGDHV